MKNLLTLTVLLLTGVAFAQQPKDDVSTLLKKADEAYKSGNYNGALTLINQAKTEVASIVANQFLVLLPTKVGEWEAKPDTKMPNMQGGGQTYSRSYTKPTAANTTPAVEKKEEPKPATPDAKTTTPAKPTKPTPPDFSMLELSSKGNPSGLNITGSITKNISAITAILNAHNTDDEDPTTSSVKGKKGEPVKIKGNKAVQSYDEKTKKGSVSVLVGTSVVLEFKGMGITGIDELIKFVDAVDLEKLKKTAGE